MKRFNSLLIIALIAQFSFSCGDKNKEEVDTTKPEVTIQTPSENDEYAIGETIHFTASFSDNKGLKSCVA